MTVLAPTAEPIKTSSENTDVAKKATVGLQHMEALKHANKVRLARAEIKRKVSRNELEVIDLVVDTPAAAVNMTVAELLLSQRRWGWIRCRKVLAAVPISETKTLGSLTDRQRSAVASQLEALQLKNENTRSTQYTPAAA